MRFILGSRKIAESLIEESSVTRSAQLALAIQDVEEAESHLAVIGLCMRLRKRSSRNTGFQVTCLLFLAWESNLLKMRLCRHYGRSLPGCPLLVRNGERLPPKSHGTLAA